MLSLATDCTWEKEKLQPHNLHTGKEGMSLSLKVYQALIDLMGHIHHFRISTNSNTGFYFIHNLCPELYKLF